MTPTDQQVTEPGKGDSLAACVASILDLSTAKVGNLDQGNNLEQLEGVLALYGYGFCYIVGELGVFRIPEWAERLCIVIGPSPRDAQRLHAVVAEVKDAGLLIVHDPHPMRSGVGKPWKGVIILYRAEKWT